MYIILYNGIANICKYWLLYTFSLNSSRMPARPFPHDKKTLWLYYYVCSVISRNRTGNRAGLSIDLYVWLGWFFFINIFETLRNEYNVLTNAKKIQASRRFVVSHENTTNLQWIYDLPPCHVPYTIENSTNSKHVLAATAFTRAHAKYILLPRFLIKKVK